MNLVSDFLDWLATLPADFLFLLAIPFAVAAAGVVADRLERREPAPRTETPSPVAAAHRGAIRPG
jgi:hypothetical protein